MWTGRKSLSHSHEVPGYVEEIYAYKNARIEEFINSNKRYPDEEKEIEFLTQASDVKSKERGMLWGFKLTKYEIWKRVRHERDQRLRADIAQIRKTYEQKVAEDKRLHGMYPTENKEYNMLSDAFVASKLHNMKTKTYQISPDEKDGLDAYVRLYRKDRKKLFGGKFGCLSCFY
jgi:hypothetical protein